MLFYTIINAVLLVLAGLLCFHKPSRSKNLIYILLAFSMLFVLLAFRKGIGHDYNMYTVGFRNMASVGLETLSYKDWEVGFVLFTKLLGLIPGMDYQWYMIILAGIAMLPAAIFIYRHSDMPWLSTILYVNLFMYFMDMNFLRQMVAVSLMMLAWSCLKRNKFILYVIVIVAASFFHQTILLMLPVYFLVKMKPGLKELLIYGFFLLWFYTASANLFNLIMNFYHEEYRESIFIIEGVSFIYAIFPLFLTVVSFLLVKLGTINLTNENKYLINLTFIGTLMMVTMSRHSIIERMSYYFIIFMILLAPVIFRSLKTKGIRYTNANEKTIDWTSPKARTILSVTFLIAVLVLSYVHFYYGLSENAHGAKLYATWMKLPWA